MPTSCIWLAQVSAASRLRKPLSLPSGNREAAVPPCPATPLWIPNRPLLRAVRDGRQGRSEAYTLLNRTPSAATASMAGLVGRSIPIAAEVVSSKRVDIEMDDPHCPSQSATYAQIARFVPDICPTNGTRCASDRLDTGHGHGEHRYAWCGVWACQFGNQIVEPPDGGQPRGHDLIHRVRPAAQLARPANQRAWRPSVATIVRPLRGQVGLLVWIDADVVDLDSGLSGRHRGRCIG